MRRVIAPAIIWCDGGYRHGGARRGKTISAIEYAAQRQKPRRCCAIPFALIGTDTALSNGTAIDRALEAQ
jgi:hypothetical protein